MASRERAQVFIFVNPSAGGNRAAVYLEDVGERPLQIRRNGVDADVWIYNIREGDSGKKEGFLQVKALSDATAGEGPLVRVMVAGGDGTVMWALTELTKTGVCMAKVAVGHIPFGTGNDFSRATGWGPTARANLVGQNREHLVEDVRRWIHAEVKDFDVWEVEITTAPDGQFFFVRDGKKALTTDDKLQHGLVDLPEGGMLMRKPMANYFSFGFSERAGIGFEKTRTRSRVLNNLRYGWEGTKKWLFRRPPSVSDVLDELGIGTDTEADADAVAEAEAGAEADALPAPSASVASTRMPESEGTPSGTDCALALGEAQDSPQPGSPTAPAQPGAPPPPPQSPLTVDSPLVNSPQVDSPQVLCKSQMSSITLDTGAKGRPRFRGTSVNLLFINIPSFAGGADPWTWSRRLAVEGSAHPPEELLRCQQDFGDGKLELLSYTGALSIGLDVVNSKARVPGRGGGCRIASSRGPFSARFKPPEAAKYKSAEGRVYFQIDGEFFVATLPKRAVVRHMQTVRVLTCDEQPAGGRWHMRC